MIRNKYSKCIGCICNICINKKCETLCIVCERFNFQDTKNCPDFIDWISKMIGKEERAYIRYEK